MIATYIETAASKPITKRQFEALWESFGAEIEGDMDIMGDPRRVMFYLRQRADGVDAVWAKCSAAQKGPGAKTDQLFFEGRHNLDQQFSDNPRQLAEMERITSQMGFKPPRNAVYEPSLAEFPFDPRAFVTGGRGEAQKRAEAKGFQRSGAKVYDGMIGMKGIQPENPIPAGKLAPDLVAEGVRGMIAANPDLARVPLRELASEVQAKHGFTDANLVERPTGLSPSASALLGKVLAKKAAQKKKPRK